MTASHSWAEVCSTPKRKANACIVDQNIQLSEARDRSLNRIVPTIFAGDIQVHEHGLPAGLGDHGFSGPAFVLQKVGDHHSCAFFSQQLGCCRTNPSGTAANQGYFARNTHGLPRFT
tara:strand:- start:191 stop:541 length:351 start_codon:yes stop_codon:yes gene_type:complete